MANADFRADPVVDDPLAELERLVNERTMRMSQADPSRLVEAPVETEAPTDPFEELLSLDLLDDMPAVDPAPAPTQTPNGGAREMGELLPSLAALRLGLDERAVQEPDELLGDFESALGDAVADAMLANGSALAAVAARPINDEVPPTTYPIDVPDLPDIAAAEIDRSLDAEFERELVDELYYIEEPQAEPGTDGDPIASPLQEAAANEERPSKRLGWLVAAMLGGVAVVGGVASITLNGEPEAGTVEVALVRAPTEPTKMRPEPATPEPELTRANPVYEKVARSANAKVAEPAPTELVASAEDVSNVRIARPASVPKVDDRLNASASEASSEVASADNAVGPRRVRTLRVGRDGQLVPSEAAPAASDIANAREAKPELPVQVASVEAPVPKAPTVPAVNEPTGEIAIGIPLPRFRPAGLVAAATTPVYASAGVTNAGIQPSAPLGASEWHVQVASVPDGAAARSVYANLSSQYASLLGGRGVDYQVAEIDGRGTFHRVRIEAAGKNDANVLCTKLKQAGASCFVTR